ncbi:uncharacterized protein CANTADRAFT_52737, partial [Suhomyces tanzawaensis NRRL Y-17324]
PLNHIAMDDTGQLKSAVYLMVARMVEQKLPAQVGASPTYIATLVELVYNQLIILGEDLEMFAHHAGRTTVEPKDMYMAVRKNESLTRVLRAVEEAMGQAE